jgi:hypothetical protein
MPVRTLHVNPWDVIGEIAKLVFELNQMICFVPFRNTARRPRFQQFFYEACGIVKRGSGGNREAGCGLASNAAGFAGAFEFPSQAWAIRSDGTLFNAAPARGVSL